MAIARSQSNLHPHTGAWAELVACELLLECGFEVFRNISQHGPHDLVVMPRGSFVAVAVDITIATWYDRLDGNRTLQCTAISKLKTGKCQNVLAVTEDRELWYCWIEEHNGDIVFKWKSFESSDIIPGVNRGVLRPANQCSS